MSEYICDLAISIRFNSQTQEQQQLFSKPSTRNSSFNVKCFKCYRQKLKYCQECAGTQLVPSTHPMAQLLNQVLMRTLNIHKIDDSKLQNQAVQPIKEEQQQIEEKRRLCVQCHNQCDSNHHYCAQCPYFVICSSCALKSYSHEHTLYENITISDCIYGKSQASIKACFNCNQNIQNQYAECKTCKKDNEQYQLCYQCMYNKAYIHSNSHIIQIVHQNQSFKDNNIDAISQEFDEKADQSFQDLQANEFQDDTNKLKKKNSSIAGRLESNDVNFGHVLTPVNRSKANMESSRDSKVDIRGSTIKFDIDFLFSSTNQIKRSKNNENLQLMKIRGSETNLSHQNKENLYINIQNKQKYAFEDYKCDICEAQPILNIRYHCLKCEDFDVCQQCFCTCQHQHPHPFQKIDARELREKALRKLLHDTNYSTIVNQTTRNQEKTQLELPVRKSHKNKTENFSLSVPL